jgi:Na+-transporting NADH:ubiquinone oxidoreductase subunit NqrD
MIDDPKWILAMFVLSIPTSWLMCRQWKSTLIASAFTGLFISLFSRFFIDLYRKFGSFILSAIIFLVLIALTFIIRKYINKKYFWILAIFFNMLAYPAIASLIYLGYAALFCLRMGSQCPFAGFF